MQTLSVIWYKYSLDTGFCNGFRGKHGEQCLTDIKPFIEQYVTRILKEKKLLQG